jgi:hypothetical protein
MEKPLDNLIGLYCIEAYCGYAGRLKINCSKYTDTLTLLTNDLKEPEWQFETVSAAWRLSEKEMILTGSYENEEHNDNFLKSLIGKKIVKIKNNNTTDFSLVFQNELKIDTFNQGLDFPPLELYNTVEGSCLILSPQGQWSAAKDEIGSTEKEELQNFHSEQTDKRWKKVVPPKSFDNHCNNCAYFLSTSGRYYFWDYGICSNKNSHYDGKVVGVKSTCMYFDHELKTDK